MPKSPFTFLILLLSMSGHSQEKKKVFTDPYTNEVFIIANDTINITKVTAGYKSIPSRWNRVNKIGVNISEIAFINWSAGGDNTITALGNAHFERNYKYKKIQWNNEMTLRFGLTLQKGEKLKKTEDAFVVNSTLGFKTRDLSDWYFSAKASFNTQFAHGFYYPDRDNLVSDFLAPGYFLFGIGSEYNPEGKNLKVYVSPITLKSTIVLNQELADEGAFGVEKAKYDKDGNKIKNGENTLNQLGFLVSKSFQTKIYENMFLSNKLSLYTDYIKSFGNIDIDWSVDIEFKVNEYVVANLGTQIVYDDDIKFKEIETSTGEKITYGSRIQFKQTLGVGVIYTF